MEELDLLKKDWKRNENSFSQLSEKEIYKMLHRKSSSLVKWILIISILEVLLWTLLSVFFTMDDYLKSMKHEILVVFFTVMTYLNYAIILVFIYLFYKNYKSISTTASTKQLMKDILRTRKTVQYYVWYNLAMMILSFMLGIVLAFLYSPDLEAFRVKITTEAKSMFFTILIMLVIIAIAAFIFWLFYRLLYGILLRKLLANYKELKKIDL